MKKFQKNKFSKPKSSTSGLAKSIAGVLCVAAGVTGGYFLGQNIPKYSSTAHIKTEESAAPTSEFVSVNFNINSPIEEKTFRYMVRRDGDFSTINIENYKKNLFDKGYFVSGYKINNGNDIHHDQGDISEIIKDSDINHLDIDFIVNDRVSGLYDLSKNNLIEWQDLINEGYFVVNNGELSKGDINYYNQKLSNYLVIDDTVTSISDSTFKNCKALKGVIMPDTVTQIGKYLFQSCTNLEEITLSQSLTEISQQAFDLCSSLKSVIIPNSVTSIAKEAFSQCQSLSKVILPNSLESIGEKAFYANCTLIYGQWYYGMDYIIIPDTVTQMGRAVFDGDHITVFFESEEMPEDLDENWQYTQMNAASSSVDYYLYSETENTDGQHWHYVNGQPVVWVAAEE